MAYYVIGIGGTGSKCIEALTHLAAAGLVDKKDVHIVLVDPDNANGNLERTKLTLKSYRDAKAMLTLGDISFLKANFKNSDSEVWSPFADEKQPAFNRQVGYSSMDPVEAGLLDVLYTDQEKSASLKKGFLGHPSIGAAVMAQELDLNRDPMWANLCNTISTDNEARVFLVGSIFGGTGASGLPTLARLLRDHFQNRQAEQFRLGALLMLPYFSFPPGQEGEMQARCEEFILRSQAALEYYQEKIAQQGTQIYDAVYLLGSQEQPRVESNSLGARTQCNPPHVLELYAASAMLDFFKQEMTASTRTHMIGRTPASSLTWDSIPSALEKPLANLARFSYAYLGYFHGKLLEVNNKETWFIEFITKERLNGQELAFSAVAQYCEKFLVWLSAMQGFTNNIHLFDTSREIYDVTNESKVVFKNDKYASLYKVEKPRGPTCFRGNPFKKGLSDTLSSKKPDDCTNASGAGKFIYALYKECEPI